MALLVYAIMRTRDARAQAAGDRDLDVVEHGEVSALVRQMPDEQVRLRRELILDHSEILQAAFKHGPLLPLRLGTAMVDAEAVRREVLAPQADVLARRLDVLDGKAEMQVKATYAEGPLLRSILENDGALRRAVERTRNLPAAATHFEQIRIGEAIAGAVEARRATDGDALLGVLRPLALTVSLAAPHHERAVLNAAFLIDAVELDRFDGAVERLSDDRSPEIEFKLIGPLPAYSFAEAEWETLAVTRTRA